MVKAGCSPELIQVGNEITFGMLWPKGKVDPMKHERWSYFCQLLKRGVKACREVCPKAKIIIHTEHAQDSAATRSYYEKLATYGVDYDIIGLSYYPMWHERLPILSETLNMLEREFPQKPVMIVETAFYYSHENDRWAKPSQYSEYYPISIEGQRQFTAELVAELNHHKNVTGLFWWFPEENGYKNTVTKGWLNRGLFNNRTGCALPALLELKKFR
jgi:arabinogalactan endo-1,4-beta-galactosidase